MYFEHGARFRREILLFIFYFFPKKAINKPGPSPDAPQISFRGRQRI